MCMCYLNFHTYLNLIVYVYMDNITNTCVLFVKNECVFENSYISYVGLKIIREEKTGYKKCVCIKF